MYMQIEKLNIQDTKNELKEEKISISPPPPLGPSCILMGYVASFWRPPKTVMSIVLDSSMGQGVNMETQESAGLDVNPGRTTS